MNNKAQFVPLTDGNEIPHSKQYGQRLAILHWSSTGEKRAANPLQPLG